MNCQGFKSVVSELARGQMMAAERRGEALAHSNVCDDCAARLRDEEMLSSGLRSLAVKMESLEAPAGIETKLLAEFRNRAATPAPTAGRKVNSRYWFSAIAAILLIAIAIVAIRSLTGSENKLNAGQVEAPQPPDVLEAPRQQPQHENNLALSDSKPQRKMPTQKRRSNRVNRTSPAVMANHVTNEIATDFMPVGGYMNAASLQDGGQIVRVELRRSALANFGVPVNMERYNEKVKADILLGVDGMACAIRFVQ